MTAGTGDNRRIAIFTICSNNYMPFAHVLLSSLRRHHPEAALFLCLADRMVKTPGLYGSDWTVIEARDLDIPDFPSFAFRYDIMEFNTALKPFMFLHLLDDRGFDMVIYFDPDIEIFSPLNSVIRALKEGASFFFTPHLCAPIEDRQEPNDLMIMRAGAYNLGFLGVSRGEETAELISWWARRLRYQCVNAQAQGIFVDQKFMDLIPSFADDVVVSHDTTLNVAYWNLGQRELAETNNGWTVDGAPLVFFHFSGFNPLVPNRLSKHDPRFQGQLSGPLSTLIAHYAARLRAAGHGSFPGAGYAYRQFASGAAIHPTIRTMFRDWNPFWGGDPFQDYEAFLHEPWPEAARPAPGVTVTNLMRFLQGVVPCLGGLDLRVLQDAEGLVRWFVNDAVSTLALDPALVEPAASRLGEGRLPAAVIPPRPNDCEMDVTVTAPLQTMGDPGESGRLTFEALLTTGLAVEMRDGETGDGGVISGAPVRIICVSADQMAALPRAVPPRSDVFRILVPVSHRARFPDAALPALVQVDEIWAPTRFIQLGAAGRTDCPVIHMPLAIELDPAVPLPRATFGLPEDRLVFLSFFGGRSRLDRRDPSSAIRAFRMAFSRRGNACLVLASDDGAVSFEHRRALEDEIGGDTDIRLLDRRLAQGEILSLTAACDAMLALHRSEGLGLSIARAMLLGRPVIAPRYAASGEFVTNKTGFPVDFQLMTADGSCWAEVDIAHAAWTMDRLADEPQRAARLIHDARAYVRHQHGREPVAARQRARLLALGIRVT